MQTILGSGGVIGNHIARELHRMGIAVRLVSRNPEKVNEDDELFRASLLEAEDVEKAVKGSDVAFLTIGLKYDAGVWREQWPVVMKNVINACQKNNVRLVFFDNVYAYGLSEQPMTENTPFRPSSDKGEVRAEVANMLLSEMSTGKIEALIARSADFYGPDTAQSFLQMMVFDKVSKGKPPQWMITGEKLHSFTYTPDAGRASALLGNTEDAYGQTWHLPTDNATLTGNEFLALTMKKFGKDYKPQILPAWMLRIIGWMIPAVGENQEMLYQMKHDYVLNSSKFFQRFPDFKYKRYHEGLDEIVEWYKSKSAL
jgi:nucleoside-diphosphate-sugar epimerase